MWKLKGNIRKKTIILYGFAHWNILSGQESCQFFGCYTYRDMGWANFSPHLQCSKYKSTKGKELKSLVNVNNENNS